MSIRRDETITANRFFDAIKNPENNNLNVARSRVSSLSSFFSTSATDGESRSIFGFRKFAKACLLGSGKSGKRNTSKIFTDQNVPNITYRQDNTVLNGSEGFLYGVSGEKLSYSNYQRQLEKNGADNIARTRQINLGSEVFDYQLDSYGVPQRIPDLFKEDNDTEIKDSVISSTSSNEDKLTEGKFEQRSIVLANVPRSTGLSSILSQVCGGPLETILLHRSEIDRTLIRVELDFLTRDGAVSFMKYSRTNLFKVNGVHLVPEWKKLSELQLPPLSDEFLEEIPEVCRCLIMKKYASGNKKYRHGDNSKEPALDNLDISEVKRDFEVFGEIQEIAPIISRKLCISISFYCVHNAIRAMDEYENPASQLYRKYFKTWAVWYGKDITDRPCTEI
ncbi:hypothetical protein HG536_0A07710 [Torulaspora globosa]|uniref:RRM domain-containing protein n=1 Tax=Torulaspora globosa TaxID=48254 RepID=A0A7G3ZBS0_9SACH|nr:uncharacterized protein HG536_0A07710 [Torulaspora globosa]QLL30956.1 hypothetical protein HG536_0A07710 [Torulaspora globosa]